MKYKLIKYDESKIKGYIDIDGLLDIYNVMGNKLIKNHEKYYNIIKSNEEYQDIFKKLVIIIEKNINNNKIYKKKYEKYLLQDGGQFPIVLPFLILGVSSSIVIGSVVAYIIYRILTAPKCRASYPLYPEGQIPKFKDIIIKLIPPNIVSAYIPNYEKIDTDDVIKSVKNFLDIFGVMLNLIAPDSLIGKAISSIVESVAGIAVTALTTTLAIPSAGAIKVINYLLKAFNVLKEAIGLLIKFVDALVSVNSLMTDNDTKRVIYDIFNMDFRDGPFGIRCNVNYIMNKYGKDTAFMKHICSILVKILNVVYDKLVAFISKILTFSIPEGGVAGVLITAIISLLKCKTFDFALLKMTQAYDKFSYDKQLLFERPPLMKKMLDDGVNNAKVFLDVINDNIIKKIENLIRSNTVLKINEFDLYAFLLSNNDFLAFSINKVLSLVFAMLNIFSLCAKQGYCDFLI